MTTYAQRDEYLGVPALDRLSGPPPADRLGAVWAARWWIICATVAAVVLTVAATFVVPTVYSADTEVSLSASPAVSTNAQDMVTAANSLAAQYAQVVTSTPVLSGAVATGGMSIDSLRTHVSSGTLASQNIVRVTAQAAGPAAARRAATAVANSLVSYVDSQGSALAKGYSGAIAAQLAPLDAQVAQAQTGVTSARKQLAQAAASNSQPAVSAAAALLNAAQSLLSTLTDRRAALTAQASLQSASLVPVASVLGGATSAHQVQPRPILYATVAGLLALALSAQAAIVWAERRRRLATSARP
jgi:uncharacterized protein involved in exopolysaccharide biosynthesis